MGVITEIGLAVVATGAIAPQAVLLVASFALGALPLTRWAVQRVSGKDLARMGTGNVGVSAAFRLGGRGAGLVALAIEITRGVLPVILARSLAPETPALIPSSLSAMVLGRFLLTRGGGVTNATWGMLFYAPLTVLSSGLTGLVLLAWGQKSGTISRVGAARWGCLSALGWFWLWRSASLSLPELWGVVGLVVLLLWINLLQTDDLAEPAVLQLSDRLTRDRHGDKAVRLARLYQAKFPVLPGWVLPVSTSAQRSGHSQDCADLVLLERELAALPEPSESAPLIVRSSAIGEDGDTSSAAGQYETIGPVTSLAELTEAIVRCRQSYWQPQAVAYRQQRQLPDRGMAVLVQPYQTSRVGGVMFSRNPMDGGDRVVIEAVAGSVAELVAGRTTPLHLEVIPEGAGWQIPDLSSSRFGVVVGDITPELVAELATQARAIEAEFRGLPQDIEWLWDGEQIWILQSRPITNLQPIWTRKIAAEVIPGVIPPLTWSINQPLTCGVWGEIFSLVLGDRASDLDFSQTATLHGSHAYFNATLLGQIFQRMGLPEQGLGFLLRGEKMGKPAFSQVLPSLLGLLRLVRREITLLRAFREDQQRQFSPALDQLDQRRSQLSDLTLSELLAQVEQIQRLLRPATEYNILGPIGLSIRRALFRVPEAELPSDTAAEINSIRDLKKIAHKLRQAAGDRSDFRSVFESQPDLQQAFSRWLDTYGYLSEVGTDIAVPTWCEQPEAFKTLLCNFAQSDRPEQFESENRNSRQHRGFLAQWRYDRCRARSRLKGEIGEVYNRLMAHLRWTMLAIADRAVQQSVLPQRDDIFFLELAELQQWIHAGAGQDLAKKIAQRQQQFALDCDRPVPPVVYGNRLPIDAEGLSSAAIAQTGELVGIPASAGCVSGPVKICRSVSEGLAQQNLSEVILVVPYTDAGWSPVLSQVRAIVAEVGGQLSHGAIIAREYGIPAVMNVTQATTRLQDGQQVEVDGDRGWVKVVQQA